MRGQAKSQPKLKISPIDGEAMRGQPKNDHCQPKSKSSTRDRGEQREDNDKVKDL